MRKRIILSLISIFAFVFFSCSGLLNDVDENSSSNKAYVQIGNTSSRTVLPAALSTDDMTDIKLIGVKDGERADLLSANTYSELTGKTKEIDAGTWSFELQATINGNTFTDSTSCTNREVNAGQIVSLTFSAMETSATTGNFSVTVNYVGTPDEISIAILNGVELSSENYTFESNVVTVSKSNVEAGDYHLSIQFLKNDVVLNTFEEIVSVKGGCTSEATYTINLNKSPAELLEQQSKKVRDVLWSEDLDITTATAFKPAKNAPATGEKTYTLDDDVHAVAWRDDGEKIIYYYNPSSDTTKISLGSTAYALFRQCIEITEIDMSGFDTSNVTNMSYMFYGCSSLSSLNVSNFNTSKVTQMNDMFYECSALRSLDLSNFDTSNVTDMARMFNGCSALETIYSASDANWSSLSGENSDGMFEGCIDLVGGKDTRFAPQYVDATYARVDSNSNPGYFTGVYTIADALKEGVELTITLNKTNETSTVKFTRQADDSYSETHYGGYVESAHASEGNGIINIDATLIVDNVDDESQPFSIESYFLTINTNESTYTENGSAVLQTIKVEGTEVTLTKE